MKKILSKVANLGTIAVLGYEIGANRDEEHNEEKAVKAENDHENYLIAVIILILLVLLFILAKIYLKKRIV